MKNIINKVLNFDDCRIETKMDESSNGKMIIKGYANVAKVDRVNELMPKSCWDLTNYKKNPTICLDHKSWDSNYLVGKAIDISAQDEGLYFEAEIGDETKAELTPNQILARSLIKQGYLKSLSVGFKAIDYDYDQKSDVIVYKKAELHEISLVTIPCQQDSFITSIKSLQNLEKVVNVEDETKKTIIELNNKIKQFEISLLELQKSTDLRIEKLCQHMKSIVKLI